VAGTIKNCQRALLTHDKAIYAATMGQLGPPDAEDDAMESGNEDGEGLM
jgi:hypothetical protein